MKNKWTTLTACSAALAMAATIVAAPVAAQTKRQQDKNNMRNLGTGLGAAAAVEALRGKGTNAIILGAGAAYAGKKYEDARKSQSKENSRRYYRSGAAPIQVVLNNDPVPFSGTRPQVMKDRVYVPLRGVLEEMGALIEWDSATQTVLANHGNDRVRLPINSRRATINGRTVSLDAPARIVDGRTVVPLRFLAEAFGADVNWDARDRQVHIATRS